MGAFLKRKKRNRKLRQKLQDELEEKKIRARFQVKTAKLSKKNAKKLGKVYGDLNPEEVNQINEIQPYVGAMADQLQEQGVELQDSSDPIEVATTYNREILGEEVGEGTDAESFELLHSEHEEEDRKKKTGGIIKAAFAGVVGAFKNLSAQAQAKKAKGETLSATDKAVLNVNEEANAQVKDAVRAKKKDVFADLFPLLAIGIVIYLLAK